MADKTNLQVMHWNANSLITSQDELKHYLKTHTPDIICVQETCLGGKSKFHVPGYTTARADKKRRSAGLATLVKTNITYTHTPLDIPALDAQAVSITCLNTTLVIVNIYRPCRYTFPHDSLQRLISHPAIRDHKHKIFCGDFNSHNPIWGSKTLSAPGIDIEQWTVDNLLIILNDGQHTYEAHHSDATSPLDLTIITPELAAKSNWYVDNTTKINSDHFPVHTTIDIRPA
jgi:exonuclease III